MSQRAEQIDENIIATAQAVIRGEVRAAPQELMRLMAAVLTDRKAAMDLLAESNSVIENVLASAPVNGINDAMRRSLRVAYQRTRVFLNNGA